MAVQVEKSEIRNIPLKQNTSSVKEQVCEENDLVEDKLYGSQTAIIIDNVEVQDHAMQYNVNKIKLEVSTILDNIKAELPSSEVQYNIINDCIKIEEKISPDDIKIIFDNKLYCEQCQAYYEEYCIGCGMLVHILNRNVLNNAITRAQEELPNNILEIQHLLGQFGIFAVKYIPEGVKFGPFTGLNRSDCPWKIKGGKFVVNKDQSKHLNWMQHINPATNISEQNLQVFQCEDSLYYRSTRQIQGGDELLVYFGEEYEDSLNRNVEVDFMSTIKHLIKDVFACTFCCLGFSSRTYLAKHKTVCPAGAAKDFSIEGLMECPFCNIHLNQKEYYEHHMTYCCERNVRKCISPTTSGNQTAEVKRQQMRPRRQLYKCGRCKYRTQYKGDLNIHVNQHYEVKTYKCGVCNTRFKTKEFLRLHVKNRHVYVGVKEDPEHSTSAHVNAHLKVRHSNSRHKVKELKCSLCDFRTKHKECLKKHKKTTHLKEYKYECEQCDFKTNYKWLLGKHINTLHLDEFSYMCDLCDYKTNINPQLKEHVKTIHLKEFDYRCDMCDYKTNRKSDLAKHVKSIHYRCAMCDYKTNGKPNLEKHVKSIHLKEFNYKCDICDYKTTWKSDLERHTKTIHFKEFTYMCDMCGYRTNIQPHLEEHLKSIHLKEYNFVCELCDFKTTWKLELERHIKTIH